MQVLQQALVLDASFAVYAVASETGMLYTVVLHITQDQKEAARFSIVQVAKDTIAWAHEQSSTIPTFISAEHREVVKSNLQFWNVVNRYVKANGPFQPLKLFKHAEQSFYSKTNGGVDGATQQRAVMRSSTSHLQCEQKLVSQVLKTLSVNAFVAWRIFERRDLLQSAEHFKSLESYRDALNRVEPTADFMLDTAVKLLLYARETNPHQPTQPLQPIQGTEDEIRLIGLAKQRKQKKLLFFNSSDGLNLRLDVPKHFPQQGVYTFCALCGQNSTEKDHEGKLWRGHRTTTTCTTCHVHLCVKLYPGLPNTCWDTWHSVRFLVPRLTPCPGRESQMQVTNTPQDVTDGNDGSNSEALQCPVGTAPSDSGSDRDIQHEIFTSEVAPGHEVPRPDAEAIEAQ